MREPKEQATPSPFKPQADTGWFRFNGELPISRMSTLADDMQPNWSYFAFTSPGSPEYFTPEEKRAAREHNLGVATQSADHFAKAFTTADNLTTKFNAVRTFVDERRHQVVDAYSSEVYSDYAAANVAFTAYQTAYNQTDSLYIRRLLEWGMNREIHEITPWPAEATLYRVDPDIDWDEWFYGEKTAERVDVELSDLAKSILAEHPEYQAMFEYGAELAAKEPKLGDDDYYAPDPYVALTQDVSEGVKKDAQSADLNYELALETSSLFGVSMSELSEPVRSRLVEYGLSLNQATHDRLKDASQRMTGQQDKVRFAEAFLATEYGNDFGDKLLSIAEHMLSEELGAILADLDKMRVGTRQIVAWFASIDGHFAEVALKGVAERTTDIITTIEAAARQGSLQIDVAPGGGDDPASKFMYIADTQQATKDLSDMANDLATKGAMVSDEKTVVSRVVVKSDKFARFRLLNPAHGTMVMNIRPYGTRTRGDHQYEIGSYNKGVEASIGMLTNPHDRFTITGTANINDVSLRFDREGHAPNVSALDPGRSTTNQEGTIAVDVASIFSFGNPDEPATRIGRAVAAGARLRAKEAGTADNLNHNPLEDQSYGDADVFATLANGVIDKLDGLAQKTSRKKLGQVAHTIVQIKDDTSLAKVA